MIEITSALRQGAFTLSDYNLNKEITTYEKDGMQQLTVGALAFDRLCML